LLPAENLGELCGRIAPRSWPPVFLLLGENLGEIRGRILARFWPPGISLPGENLAGIPARFPPGRKIPAAKISPGSRRDPAKIPVLILQGLDQDVLKRKSCKLKCKIIDCFRLNIFISVSAKQLMRKKSEEDQQTLEESNSAHHRSHSK